VEAVDGLLLVALAIEVQDLAPARPACGRDDVESCLGQPGPPQRTKTIFGEEQMKSILHRFNCMIQVFLALLGIACAFPAQAAYNYTSIDYPGVDYSSGGFTQVFGINVAGELVGNAAISGTSANIPFVYNPKTKLFTVLPNFSSASTASLGINDFGVVVGGEGALESGFILDKGAFTIFSHPGSVVFTEARAINDFGLVTGYADTGANTSGFIYDRRHNSFIDILPSPFTLAQGINIFGQVVGSVTEAAGAACPTCPAGSYGFLRSWTGAITLFRVNGGATTARGIMDFGRITGRFHDAVANKDRGYVATLARAPGFQSLTIPDRDLLDVPGAVATIPEGINDFGRVAGIWTDGTGATRGFLATPSGEN
jgi:hypothetical protein